MVTSGADRAGQVKADEAGTATVHVVVRPGVREAHSGTRTIALKVPEMPLLAVVLARARALADREERIEVALFAVTADGRPRTDAVFQLEASRGSVSAPQGSGPAESSAAWTVPPGAPGKVVLTAALA